ncbi:MAG: leucine-rich repeat protein [Oscillospiraceae bacterium]|nr:leucine-rich repeat protein [Oscillospiraceae bacterium]
MKHLIWRKPLAAALALALSLAMLPLGYLRAAALTSGIYTYEVSGGIATITRVDGEQAAGVISIPETLGGVPVRAIGDSAFQWCDEVTELIVGDHITSIGPYAFYFMLGLRKATIGSGVTAIPADAFFYDTALREVILGPNVQRIGDEAFKNCEALENMTLPDGVMSIGRAAFEECRALRTFTPGTGLTTIGASAFRLCSVLGTIELPTQVTSIGNLAFSGCPLLRIRCGYQSAAHRYAVANNLLYTIILILEYIEITRLPSKLIYLVGESFNPQGMVVMARYDDPTQDTAISAYELTGFSSAAAGTFTLTIRYENKTASFQVTVYDYRYTFLNNNTAVAVTEYLGASPDAVIPQTIEGKPVTMLAAGTFAARPDVTSVTLSAGLTDLRPGAFDGATGITQFFVSPGNPVYTAADGILFAQNGTRLVAYPAGRSDSAYSIPEGVTAVAGHAFASSAALTDVTALFGVTVWDAAAVYQCPNLKLRIYEYTAAHDFALANGVPFVLLGRVSALALDPLPTKLVYRVGDSFDPQGMRVILRYDDGVSNQLTAGYTVAGFHSLTVSVRTVTIGYKGLTAQFQVSVTEPDQAAYQYRVQPDGTALITRYVGRGGDLTVPGMIDGYVVSGIGDSAFEGCAAIASAVLPDSAKTIGNRAFANCTAMTALTLPANLRSLGNEALVNCTGLTQLALPSTLQDVGSYALSGGTGILRLDLPDALLRVGAYAFANMTALTEVTIGAQLLSLGNYAFSGCAALQNVLVAAANETYSDTDGVLYNKTGDALLRYPQGRAENAFQVPAAVKSLEVGCFSGALALESLTILRGVTSIAGNILSGASAQVIIYGYRNTAAQTFATQNRFLFVPLAEEQPNGMELLSPPDQLEYYIGDTLVTAGLRLRLLYPSGPGEEVSSGWTTSGFSSAAAGSCAVTVQYRGFTVTFSVTVRAVSLADFVIDSSGSTVTIIRYVGSNPTVLVPSSMQGKPVTAIDSDFKTSAAITELILPASVQTIGNGAFQGMTSLASVLLPANLTSIGSSVFRGCTGLTSLTLPAGLTALPGDLFYGCTSLRTLTLPVGLTSIGDYAFYNCSALKYLPLPETLQTIGVSAFSGCAALKHLSIPAAVNSIGAQAFARNSALVSVFLEGSNLSIASNAFTSSAQARLMAEAGTPAQSLAFSPSPQIARYQSDGDWCYVIVGGQAELIAYVGAAEELTVPAALGGVPVGLIAPHAFFLRSALQTVVFPDSVRFIGAGAFALCAALLDVEVADRAAQYGDAEVFYGSERVTLAAEEGSSTQTYAVAQGLGFRATERVTFIYAKGVRPFYLEGRTAQGEKIVSGFTPVFSSAGQVIVAFTNPGIYIIDADGNALEDSDRVGTNARIQLWDEATGRLVDEMIILVYGDLSGDGYINSVDSMMIRFFLANEAAWANCDPLVRRAADVNRSGSVTMEDVQWINEAAVYLRSIPQETAW